MIDLHQAGGIPAVLNILAPIVEPGCPNRQRRQPAGDGC